MFKEEDLQVEYPSDTDDEYITEKGFQPTLPGEHTRLSSALALFRVTRILARVLDTNYPSATTYDLTIQQMSALESELDAWHDSLPGHLKLKFVQDKPSTDVTGSRSPLLVSFIHCVIPPNRPQANKATGNGILLHPHAHLPTGSRLFPWSKGRSCAHVRYRFQQAHYSNLGAAG